MKVGFGYFALILEDILILKVRLRLWDSNSSVSGVHKIVMILGILRRFWKGWVVRRIFRRMALTKNEFILSLDFVFERLRVMRGWIWNSLRSGQSDELSGWDQSSLRKGMVLRSVLNCFGYIRDVAGLYSLSTHSATLLSPRFWNSIFCDIVLWRRVLRILSIIQILLDNIVKGIFGG
jgi:hypothetical protein